MEYQTQFLNNTAGQVLSSPYDQAGFNSEPACCFTQNAYCGSGGGTINNNSAEKSFENINHQSDDEDEMLTLNTQSDMRMN